MIFNPGKIFLLYRIIRVIKLDVDALGVFLKVPFLVLVVDTFIVGNLSESEPSRVAVSA